MPYMQTEACRFYEGPIDALEPLINAWPIDERYIDYVVGEPDAGILNAPARYPRLTAELRNLARLASLATARDVHFEPEDFVAKAARSVALVEALKSAPSNPAFTGLAHHARILCLDLPPVGRRPRRGKER